MAQFAWDSKTVLEPGREYSVMASKLPLKRHVAVPGFMWNTMTIRRQLVASPGLVGYALLAELPKKTFWTFSVWEDRARLDAFARSNPHAEIIRNLQPKMSETVFAFEDVDGSALPWGWDEVKRRLQVASQA